MNSPQLDRRKFLAIAGLSATAAQLPLYHLERNSLAANATTKLRN